MEEGGKFYPSTKKALYLSAGMVSQGSQGLRHFWDIKEFQLMLFQTEKVKEFADFVS